MQLFFRTSRGFLFMAALFEAADICICYTFVT